VLLLEAKLPLKSGVEQRLEKGALALDFQFDRFGETLQDSWHRMHQRWLQGAQVTDLASDYSR